jgi:hypothetical protein
MAAIFLLEKAEKLGGAMEALETGYADKAKSPHTRSSPLACGALLVKLAI